MPLNAKLYMSSTQAALPGTPRLLKLFKKWDVKLHWQFLMYGYAQQ
jgi:hypothetical protein